MWLIELIDDLIDFARLINLIKDVRRNGWRVLLWPAVFAISAGGCALLMVNGFPIIGAIGFACIILLGFVLLIRYALRSEKNAHKECARKEKKPSPQGEALMQNK